MPKVMPVAIKDQTGDFVLQMAKGNQALARLYAQLLARYEERQAQQEFQREMFEKGVAARKDYFDYTNPQPEEGTQQHPFGSRGAPGAATPAPSVAPTAPAAKPAAKPMPMMPGATPIPGQDSFTSNAPTTPASPVSGQVPVTPGYDSFAQAGAGDQEFSAQSRIGQQQSSPLPRQPRAVRSVAAPAGQLPRGTGMDPAPRRTRRPPAQADFLPIGQEWLEKMAAAEKKYNVPQGSILALYGFENSGGRFLGKNPKSSAAGLFQFTEALMKDYKLDPALRNNPDVMIDLAARNMRRNANVLEKHYGIKLEPNAQTLPFFTFMHQFGVTDGPRFVKQYLTNPNVPATVIMDQVPGRNNPKILADNGIPSNSTVGKLFDQHTGVVQPWYDNGLKLLPHTAAPAPAATAQPAPTQAAAPTTPPATGPQRTEPYGPLTAMRRGPEDNRGVNPRLIAAARGGEQYLPEGYTLKLTSGARPTGRRSSQHFSGNASDWQIYGPDGKPIKNSGPDSTGMYERWARGVKAWVAENDPQLAPRMAWGGAFETSRGSGRADLMHLDLGGNRGQLVPRYQYANLKPLSATDKRGATAVAAATTGQQPQQPPAQQVAMRAPKPSEMGDVTKAFGVTPSEPLTATKDVYQEAMFGDPKQAAPIPRIASSPGGQPVPAGDETLSARSGLNFIAGGPPVMPQASGVAARSDLDYGMQREAPAVGPYEAPPTPTPEQREAPLVGPYEAPPQYDETVVEGPTTPQDQLELPPDWEQMQRGPDIAGPPISLQGQLPNFPPTTPTELPPWELPDVASLPPTPPAFEQSRNYDPSSRAGRRIDAARRQQIAQAGVEYPMEDYPQYQDPRMNIYERVARGAVDTANIVPGAPATTAAATAEPPMPPSAQPKPTTIRDITKAIYGSEIVRPRYSGGRGADEVAYARGATQAPSRLSNAVDLEKMKEAITQTVGAPGDKYGARPPAGTPNSVMEMIKQAADAYIRWKQPSVQADAIKKKPQAYGADWMPKAPQATTAKPTKPGDEDEAPAPATPLKVIPKPGGAQQSTQMPNVTQTGPAAPKGGGSGAARKAAAMARAKELGEKMYSWDNDEGATEFGELP